MKKNNVYKKLLNKPVMIYEKFHSITKIKKIPELTDPKDWPESWKTVYFKSYPRLNEIILPKPRLSEISLKNCLYRRKSIRKFSATPLSLSKLSTLLYYSAGMKDNVPPYINRFYPSAGGRYPLEVYLVLLKAKDLPKGLFHYCVKNHSLEELLVFERSISFQKYFLQKWILDASCVIIITSIFKRTTIKYGERGYRHILAEAGNLSQNIYLVSSALNITCCAIGGYIEEKLEKLLDVDRIEESIVYLLAIGNSSTNQD